MTAPKLHTHLIWCPPPQLEEQALQSLQAAANWQPLVHASSLQGVYLERCRKQAACTRNINRSNKERRLTPGRRATTHDGKVARDWEQYRLTQAETYCVRSSEDTSHTPGYTSGFATDRTCLERPARVAGGVASQCRTQALWLQGRGTGGRAAQRQVARCPFVPCGTCLRPHLPHSWQSRHLVSASPPGRSLQGRVSCCTVECPWCWCTGHQEQQQR